MKNITIQDGNGSYALVAPDYIDTRVLAANVEETHTVPSNATHVIFSATGDFYVRYNATAAVPSADIIDGTGSELNPTVRHLSLVSTIHIIAPAVCTITLAFFRS